MAAGRLRAAVASVPRWYGTAVLGLGALAALALVGRPVGLGLAIARWIVDAHGGDIRAVDNEPHGCRIIVTLPERAS